MSFACGVCDMLFDSAESLDLHWAFQVQDIRHLNAPGCCKACTSRERKQIHMRDHQYHNICIHCDHDYLQDRLQYELHWNTLRQCVYPSCGLMMDKNYLSSHLYAAHNHCMKCDEQFQSVEAFKSHQASSTAHF
ncbi:hypothetical protein F4805DRAFT_317589 [Annulohypoxylon moriforme]|nr:hypothetical protein F4805DRAFT_317589 [Annulohypoxylon moriforme]